MKPTILDELKNLEIVNIDLGKLSGNKELAKGRIATSLMTAQLFIVNEILDRKAIIKKSLNLYDQKKPDK